MIRRCPQRGAPKPFCRCGCGRRVNLWRCKFATPGCVPRELRRAAGLKGRQTYTYRRRALFFREELDRLRAERQITRESLAAMFYRVYHRGFEAGYHSADRKHAARAQRQSAA